MDKEFNCKLETVYTLQLPIPPGVNQLFVPRSFNKISKSLAHVRWYRHTMLHFNRYCTPATRFKGPVDISVRISRDNKFDVDNPLKELCDFLQDPSVAVIDNDRSIERLLSYRSSKQCKGFVRIAIRPAQEVE